MPGIMLRCVFYRVFSRIVKEDISFEKENHQNTGSLHSLSRIIKILLISLAALEAISRSCAWRLNLCFSSQCDRHRSELTGCP